MNSLILACFALLHGKDPWEALAGSMDSVSTFTFSQSGIGDPADPQISAVAANLNIRTFSSWQNGTQVSEYNASQLAAPRNAGVTVVSGLTATVVFRSEASSDSAFMDWISRDAHGDTVPHGEIVADAYRGNLACPGFREHVLQIARTQIDFGTDGIFFDEVDGGFNGGAAWNYNGNEGFDDYHLKEFNQWLVNRYPSYGKADFISAFAMAPANALDPAKPLDDLSGNFNYRNYLATKGWASNPHIAKNPLATLYGKPVGNRMVLHANNFLDSSNTAHWRAIVSATRQYARSLGREVLVTSNGIEPFVDFNTFGLYNWNNDGPGGVEVSYVPVKGATLDGSVSLLPVFQSLRRRSAQESAGAPLTAFLDWPTATMDSYYALSATQKMDYWRIYGAEAYAAGISLAFHLQTSMPNDPTATQSGILDSLRRTVAFYKQNADLFHGLQWDLGQATVSDSQVATSCAWKASSGSWIVHLVNHHYGSGIAPMKGLEVDLPLDNAPKSVTMVSSDADSTRRVVFSHGSGILKMTVDSLYSSAILVVETGIPNGLRSDIHQHPQGIQLRRTGESWVVSWPGHAGASLEVFSTDGRHTARMALDGESNAVLTPTGNGVHLIRGPGCAVLAPII
jgi:hypothetical protein